MLPPNPAATLVNHYEFRTQYEKVFTILEALHILENAHRIDQTVQIMVLTQYLSAASQRAVTTLAAMDHPEDTSPHVTWLPPTYIISALAFNNLAKIPGDHPLLSIQAQSQLRDAPGAAVRSVNSRQAIMTHWLVDAKQMHVYDLLTLMFLFRHHRFEDTHDLYHNRLEQLFTQLTQAHSVERPFDPDQPIPLFEDIEPLLRYWQNPALQVDVSRGAWRQFFGMVLAQCS